jgi:TetR/AcrR family transcriptional repressor of bet genes
MEPSEKTRRRITDAAVAIIGEAGLIDATVARIAKRAGVSSALVHYHFDTKARLITSAAAAIAARRIQSLRAALSRATGMQTVDALWTDLASRAQQGIERAYLEMSSAVRDEPGLAPALEEARRAERAAISRRLPQLLRELGVGMAASPEELSAMLAAALDGMAIALVSGEPEGSVRAAYDALWLTLVAAGQSVARP